MKLRQWIQMILITACVFALMGCHAKRKTDQSAINDANAAYATRAQTAGLGEESRFGDQSSDHSNLNLAAKHIYYFDFDSNVVHDVDKPAIEANADYMLAHENAKTMLEGHTDPRGSREYNIGLGERRARAVAEIMREKGINPSQIRIVSYGAQKLAVSGGHSEADYQKDRRVALVYLQR
ncbi:MAG TPA: OmpA family protein [Gammaproteobacteria bacterium]|nr:OmpA family protein [Gammaproteobacteria bacterium]